MYKTVVTICPSCCCCGIYSLVLLWSTVWCPTSSTMDVLQTYVTPWSTCNHLVQKTNEEKKRKTVRKYSTIFAFSRACGRWGHVFATTRSANRRSWIKKVAVSPSSGTTVHQGQHDISHVLVSWLIRAGANPPPYQYRLHNLHILASYSPPRAVNFKEGDMATFFYRT